MSPPVRLVSEDPEPEPAPRKKSRYERLNLWKLHGISKETKWRAALISAITDIPIGKVVERAIICYANTLRIAEYLESEFPKAGIEAPPVRKGRTNKSNLNQFPQHKAFMESRKGEPLE